VSCECGMICMGVMEFMWVQQVCDNGSELGQSWSANVMRVLWDVTSLIQMNLPRHMLFKLRSPDRTQSGG